MSQKTLFKDKNIGYHTFGLKLDDTLVPETSKDPYGSNGHEYVNLDLPSGTLWAKCNIGAETEDGEGLCFQWGDTQGYTEDQVGSGEGQKMFDWSTYKWIDDPEVPTFTKYTEGGALSSEDDAAKANMGGRWCMPTSNNFQELFTNTNQNFVDTEGKVGIQFISKQDSSKYIFIPFAKYFVNDEVYQSAPNSENACILWSSSYQNAKEPGKSIGAILQFNNKQGGIICSVTQVLRCVGAPIRGILRVKLTN